MALKYRIVYDDYSQYKKTFRQTKFPRALLTLLLCSAIILLMISTNGDHSILEMLLPGDPSVSAKAFLNLSEDLSRGEAISSALDAFCETIMYTR